MQEDTRLLKIIRNVALVGGAALLVPAFYLLGKSVTLLTSGGRAQGHVAEVLPLRPSGSRGAPQIVVVFTTRDGRTVRFTDIADRMYSHDVGQAVEVLYDRRKPLMAVLNKPHSLWLGAYHLTLVGGALWLLAYLVHRAVKQRGRLPAAQP